MKMLLAFILVACGPLEASVVNRPPVPIGRTARGGATLATQESKRTAAAINELIRESDPRLVRTLYTIEPYAAVETTRTCIPGAVYFMRLNGQKTDMAIKTLGVRQGDDLGIGLTQAVVGLYKLSVVQGVPTLSLIDGSTGFSEDSNTTVVTYAKPIILLRDEEYFVGVVASTANLDECVSAVALVVRGSVRTLEAGYSYATGLPPKVPLSPSYVTTGLFSIAAWAFQDTAFPTPTNELQTLIPY